VLAPEIFACTRDRPRLSSACRKLARGPPANFKGEHLKLGLKFSTRVPITLGLMAKTPGNFTRRREQGTRNYVVTKTTKFGAVPQPNLEGRNVHNLVRFLTTFDFDRKYLQNTLA